MMMAQTDVLDRVKERLFEHTRRRTNDGQPSLSREARNALVVKLVQDVLQQEVVSRSRNGEMQWTPEQEHQVTSFVLAELSGLGQIDLALADPTVEEIVATSHRWWLTYHSDGRVTERPDLGFSTDQEMREWLSHLARTMGRTERQFNAQSPLLVMRVGEGLRLSATCDVSKSTSFSLRRNTLGKVSVDDLVERGMFPRVVGELLQAIVRAPEARLVIVGATGAGKTTLARALLNGLPRLSRLVVIEDTAELDLFDEEHHPNVESWEARLANSEGEGEIGLGELVKHGLRYRPDLLILGETRSADAAVPMLQAMTHGQASLTTVHAESARDGLEKLALLLATGGSTRETAHFQLSRAVDFVIHLDRGSNGARYVTELVEVAGFEQGNVLTNTVFASSGPHQVDSLGQVHAQARKVARGGFNAGELAGGRV